MHTWLGFTRLMRVYHVRNTVTHFELDISRCTSSTEARQASVSSRAQAAFAFQSWVGNERHMSLFGNLNCVTVYTDSRNWILYNGLLETCRNEQQMN